MCVFVSSHCLNDCLSKDSLRPKQWSILIFFSSNFSHSLCILPLQLVFYDGFCTFLFKKKIACAISLFNPICVEGAINLVRTAFPLI